MTGYHYGSLFVVRLPDGRIAEVPSILPPLFAQDPPAIVERVSEPDPEPDPVAPCWVGDEPPRARQLPPVPRPAPAIASPGFGRYAEEDVSYRRAGALHGYGRRPSISTLEVAADQRLERAGIREELEHYLEHALDELGPGSWLRPR